MPTRFVLCGLLVFGALSSYGAEKPHPRLFSERRIAELAQGGAEWTKMKSECDANLNKLIYPGYAGGAWRGYGEYYGLCYRVLKQTAPKEAAVYARKALALMQVMAHHNMYGSIENAELLGLGDGTRTVFELPRIPMPGTPVEVFRVPTKVVKLEYKGAAAPLGVFAVAARVSNTENGPADYAPQDYRIRYLDNKINAYYVLCWLTDKHPAPGATYYVTLVETAGKPLPGQECVVKEKTLTMNAAPKSGEAVLVRYLADNYDQTGNYLGGLSSVQPDGPGYPMRCFGVGMARTYDLLYDFPEFTPDIKKEIYTLLNEEVEWYKAYGYKSAVYNNYFIRSYLMGTYSTAYATAGDNPRAEEWQALSQTLVHNVFNEIKKLTGGTSKDGQYANGVANDLLDLFTQWKELASEELLPQLKFFDNLIPTLIQATKPDRKTFYDGGDWTDLPATPLRGAAEAFVRYRPDHPMASYARQYLKDLGDKMVTGSMKDYTKDFPTAYFAEKTGPVFVRSDWGTEAVWWSLEADLHRVGRHRDNGHITIQRGADYLLVDSGGYGNDSTDPFHNTLLFDDRAGKKLITYPPSQGYWGRDIKIQKFEADDRYVYAQADFGGAYAQHYEGRANSVKLTWRSIFYLRPDILVVHDQAQVFEPTTVMIYNLNFGAAPRQQGNILVVERGASKLFVKPVLPAGTQAKLKEIKDEGFLFTNYRVSTVGKAADTFLYVFQATDKSKPEMVPVACVKAGEAAQGVELTVGDTHWVALFAVKDKDLPEGVKYGTASAGAHRHFLSDLTANAKYLLTVTSAGKEIVRKQVLASPEGTVTFDFTSEVPVKVELVRFREPGAL